LFGNVLEFLGDLKKKLKFYLTFLGNFLEFFLEDFFGGIFLEDFFWEKFFGRIFLGGLFWEDFLGGFFGRNFLGGIFWEEFFVCIGIDLFVKILVFVKILSQGRKISIFRSVDARSSHLKMYIGKLSLTIFEFTSCNTKILTILFCKP
jgi:hypothetical protein